MSHPRAVQGKESHLTRNETLLTFFDRGVQVMGRILMGKGLRPR